MQMKSCNSCLAEKLLAEFKRDKRRTGGFSAICKICSKAAAATWRLNNQEHTQAYDAVRDHSRSRPHAPQNIVAHRLYNKAWELANPDKVQANWRNKRAKRSAALGVHTADDITRIFQQQKGKCAYCRTNIRKGYHVDHINPLAKGGTNWPMNLQLLCAACNTKKSATDPILFSQKLGFLL
jgi:hypothetical protein